MAHEKEIIAHLSSEITANIQKMSELRSKSNLAVFLGPYILLGAALVRGGEILNITELNTGGWIAVGVLIICFMGMGLLMAGIEKHNKKQCNNYRDIIISLQTSNELKDSQLEKIPFGERFILVYITAYFLLIISFMSIVFLISIVFV